MTPKTRPKPVTLTAEQAFTIGLARQALAASRADHDPERQAYHCGALEYVLQSTLDIISELTSENP